MNNLRCNHTDSPDWHHFLENHVTDGEPNTVVSANVQKIKSIKNVLKHIYFYFFLHFYFIKSETSDSFGNHFDGHFAYLKTLDFSFNSILHHVAVYLLYKLLIQIHYFSCWWQNSMYMYTCVKNPSVRYKRYSTSNFLNIIFLFSLFHLMTLCKTENGQMLSSTSSIMVSFLVQ